MRRFSLLAFVILFLFGCSAGKRANRQDANIIRIKGSDTMLNLVQRWAEAFMLRNPGVSVYTEGGGSRTGIAALIDGKVDIAAVSRPLQADEIRELVEKQNSLGISVLCAKDALSVYLNLQNPVRNLTSQQIRDVFTGKISSWRDLGGEDATISVIGRTPNSGTYLFFEEHILLGTPYRDGVLALSTTEAVVDAVAKDRYAIGYGGMAYGQNVFHAFVDGVEPSGENVRNGDYPLARYLYLYTAQKPTAELKKFIDWVLGREGQAIVQQIGYIPLYPVQ